MSSAGLSFSFVIFAGYLVNDCDSDCVYDARCMISVIAQYSASAVDNETATCFFDTNPTGIPLYVRNTPATDCQSTLSFAQSASELAVMAWALHVAPTSAAQSFLRKCSP